MGEGAVIALNLIFGLLDRVAEIQTLLQTAQKEGRDVTEAELDLMASKDDAARAALDAAIKAARQHPK